MTDPFEKELVYPVSQLHFEGFLPRGYNHVR